MAKKPHQKFQNPLVPPQDSLTADQLRPSTAPTDPPAKSPSHHHPHHPAKSPSHHHPHHPAKSPSHHLPFEIPRIAIFSGSFHNFRKSRSLRKSPTLENLSAPARPPQSRSLSTSSVSSRTVSVSSRTVTGVSASETKPPPAKRPPASRSSHGIGTNLGPPPAIITRGSYELALHTQSPVNTTLATQKHNPYNLNTRSRESLPTENNDTYTDRYQNLSEPTSLTPNQNQSLNDMMHGHSPHAARSDSTDDKSSSRYTDALSPGPGGASGGDGDESARSEDLFLNLARDSPLPSREEGNQSRSGRKLSRGRQPEQRQSLPHNSETVSRPRRDSSGHDSGYAARIAIQNKDALSQTRRASASVVSSVTAPRNAAAISTEQRFNVYRNRYMTNPSQPPSYSSSARRPSTSDATSLLVRASTYRPSRLNNSSLREFDSASNTGSRLGSHVDMAESVVSAAPSTVWDELHELKSRIHKIELAEQPSSGSNGSGERPRTATTTVTTMSSSPKYAFKTGSRTESSIGGPGAINIHPLLHHSLARCKMVLNPGLYRSLEAAASDAIETAIMAGSGGSGYGNGSVINGGAVGRQLRRKADNVCRNLTDLCIALCEGKLDLPPLNTFQPAASLARRRDSQDMPSPQSNTENMIRTFSRAASLEPEPTEQARAAAPSRALERIASRRVSMMSAAGGESGGNSPREARESNQRESPFPLTPANAVATPSPQQISKAPSSSTSLLKIRRRQTEKQAELEEEEDDPTLRAPSRANTEISSARRRSFRLSPAFSTSREYTSQHPLPGSSPMTQSSPSLRRLNGSSLKADAPRSPSNGSSLLRQTSRQIVERERAGDSDATEEEASNARKLKRRSLGLYTSTRTSAAGQRSGRSVATSGAE
ncbi:hypothetical protein E6O75_ATG02819 [Venturia nashicola]|uniref:Uncharacterized protein n=1 Tax=Venturia nashicola TaxID=86259 RepID=A0A4Z1PPV3_9PEZI|nr:hypothetical protein E6O75_ATG02819 [Venturia nashicola]